MDPNQHKQTIVEHLTELRERLIKIFAACLAGMVICYNFTDDILDFIRKPIAPYLSAGGLIFTAPMDKFMAHLKIAFFGGIILMFPFIAWQIWKFVAPGLYSKEKKFASLFVASGSLLFLAGLSFAYFIMFPMAFKFLMTFGGDIDKPMISITEYLSFFVTTSLAFGAAFELPLAIVLLAILDIVQYQTLRKSRRYAIFGMAVLSGVIAPPDLLSMLLLLVPLVILFEAALFVVSRIDRGKSKNTIEITTPASPIP